MLSDLIKQNVYIPFKYETISVYFLLCILILLSEVQTTGCGGFVSQQLTPSDTENTAKIQGVKEYQQTFHFREKWKW